MLLQSRSASRGLDVLEPICEIERVGVENGELLLDRDGEVGRGLELLARERDELVRGEALLVTHRGALQ